MKSILTRIIKITIPLGLGLFLFWYFFHQMDQQQLDRFYSIILTANYGWILISLLLSLFTFLIRAERWKLTLEPLGHSTKFINRFHSLMIGYIINLTIPRAGEISRAGMLYRSEKVPFSQSFGTIISERVVDLIFLTIIASTTYLLNISRFTTLYHRIKITFGLQENTNLKLYFMIIAVLIIAIIGLCYLLIKPFKTKVQNFIRGLISGVLSIFKMKRQFLFWFYSLLIWLLYIAYFGICFYAIPEATHTPIAGILLAFVAGSLGITFTNGGIGAFPLLIGLVFEIINSNPDALVVGNALGLLIWSSQTLLVILLGIFSLMTISKPYGKDTSR